MAHEDAAEGVTISFVRTAVGSVCALDLLLMLRRQRQRAFRLNQLVRELRSSELAVAQATAQLMKSGLIEEVSERCYKYRDGTAPIEAVCDRLEADYAQRPASVIRAIVEAPDAKLRIFADAFRLSGKTK